MEFFITHTLSFIAGLIAGWYIKRPDSAREAWQQFRYERAEKKGANEAIKVMNKDIIQTNEQVQEIVRVKEEVLADKQIDQ